MAGRPALLLPRSFFLERDGRKRREWWWKEEEEEGGGEVWGLYIREMDRTRVCFGGIYVWRGAT